MSSIDPGLLPALFLRSGIFVWLSVWTFLDIVFHYKQRCFFLKTLEVINLNKREIRGENPLKIHDNVAENIINKIRILIGYNIPIRKSHEPVCPALTSCGNDPNICPIIKNLGSYLQDSEADSTNIKKNMSQINDMWNIIRRSSVIRPQQAAFLELIIVQIFIIVFWPILINSHPFSELFVQNSYWNALFSVVLILLFGMLVITYINSRPLFVYENRGIRLILVLGSWMVFFMYLGSAPNFL